MLKKRIYLPEKCGETDCLHYTEIMEACSECPIYKKSVEERQKRGVEAHRRAAIKYYHKNKKVKKHVKTA